MTGTIIRPYYCVELNLYRFYSSAICLSYTMAALAGDLSKAIMGHSEADKAFR